MRGGRARLTVAATLCAAGIAAGCGSNTATQPQVDVGPNVGNPINLADCNDWNQATVDQRIGTLKELENFAGGPIVGNDAKDPAGTGRTLGEKDAYELFERYCASDLARGFKLYKLYERAAAFSNVR
jgi:hypothetical protein